MALVFNDAQRPTAAEVFSSMKHFATQATQLRINGGEYYGNTLTRIKDEIETNGVGTEQDPGPVQELGIPAEFLIGPMGAYYAAMGRILTAIAAEEEILKQWHKEPPF